MKYSISATAINEVKVYKLKHSFFHREMEKRNGLSTLWQKAIQICPKKHVPIDDYVINESSRP